VKYDSQTLSKREGTWALRQRPILIGLFAAAGLMAFYVVVVLAGSGSTEHLWSLMAEDAWFVAAITAGFGIQIGLFAHLRGAIKATHGRMSTAMAATGTGGSTMAMVACCAHHVADILPLAGMTAASLFLSEYKRPLMTVGLVATAIGILWMLWQIRRHRQHYLPAVAPQPDSRPACH
jgi:hypothetical protein